VAARRASRRVAASLGGVSRPQIGVSSGSRRIGLGRFRYESTADPCTFIVRVRGIDGPKLLKDAIGKAEVFGSQHPEGWVWITDLRGLIWTSPRSLRYVRRIRKLPGNRGYAVVARQPFRLVGKVGGRLFGAQRFVKTPEKALEFAARRL
jgi:hypothetical protein